MKQFVLTSILVFVVLFTYAQDWTGFYAFTVDKETEDGKPYKVNVDMQIYKLHGDYWGEMRVSGNENFGASWAIELWTLDNGNSLYCYYSKGNDDLYKMNALVFSLEGSRSNFTTVFGPSTEAAIQFLATNPGFTFVSKKAEENDGSIYTAPTGNNTATIQKPVAPKAEPVAKKRTQGTSKFEQIIGTWSGEVVDDLYKYHDYYFKIDGTGTQNGAPIEWEMVEDAGLSYVKITGSRRISRSEYQDIMVQASSLEALDTYTLVKTPKGDHKLKIEGENYSLITNPKLLQVNKINNIKLVLSIRGKDGKLTKTKYTRQ